MFHILDNFVKIYKADFRQIYKAYALNIDWGRLLNQI